MASPPRAHASVSSVVHYYRLSPGPNAPGGQDLASRGRVHNTRRYGHPLFGVPGLSGRGDALFILQSSYFCPLSMVAPFGITGGHRTPPRR